jgi:hypothetical protein
MTLARMVGTALLFCCALTAAQDQQVKIGRLPENSNVIVSDRLPGNSNMIVLGKDENGRYKICRAVGPFPCDGRRAFDARLFGSSNTVPHEDAAQRLEEAANTDKGEDSHITSLDLNSDHGIFIYPDGLGLDGVCFAIRSYVMVRDRKDSDSTHLVHTSTCQPASRYHFRTAELRQETPSH